MTKLQLTYIRWWRLLLLIVILNLPAITAFAQSRTITGRIVDEKSEPLVGATIRVTGTTVATSTNINGDFSLNIPANAQSLTITFLGYLDLVKNITPTTKNIGSIPMAKNSKDLNEVVVVGYGTLKKQDVTGTVVSVDAKTLQEIPSDNVVTQLQGRVAGLDVVNGANGPIIDIRGDRTIGATAGTDGPLIVLDGQPYYNSINDINPNDIKSVEVLKGASATAIYGSRASGGVLLITTNRGRVGQTVTSYDSYVGQSRPEGGIKLLNGKQFAQLQTDALQGAQLQGSGTTNPYALSAMEQQALAQGISTNYPDLLLHNGLIWDQSLRVSGGTERTQFTVGVGSRVSNDINNQPNNSSDRYTLNATLDHKISKYIKFGLTTLTTVQLINTGGGDQLLNARYMSPLTNPYNANGTLNILPESDELDATTLNPLVPGRNPNQFYNYTTGFVNNDIGYLEVTPVSHLSYRYTINYNYSQSLQGVYNGINGASILNIAQTNATTNNNYEYRLAQEHLLTYDNTFFGVHHINFVAVFRTENEQTENSSITGTGIPEDAVQNTNLGLAQAISAVSGTYGQEGLISYIGRLNYAFNNKYDFTASVTTDGNSELASGHQYTTYPSFGLGWVISNENFMKQFTFIDNLKLRAGYGVTSTTASSGPYQTLGQLSASNYQYGGASAGDAQGVRVTTLVNTNLTWQRTGEYNLALDFALLKNRLNGSIEVYQQKTTGIILPNNLPITNGASSQVSNLGSSEDRGLEITLSSINVQNAHGFTWTTDYNMAFNRERVVALPNGGLINTSAGEFVGQPLNVIYDVRKIGIWQTDQATQAAVYGEKPGQIRIQDLNGDGKITSSDNQIIGHFNPNYTLGMTNRFTYKNLDLSIVIQGKMGFTTIVPYVSSSNSSLNGWQFLNLGRHNQPVLDYWTPTNPTNAFPEPNAQFQPPYYSTLQYYDGSYIRAKSINLGYTFSSRIAKYLGMSSLRIYANVTDPFIIYAPIMHHGFSVPDPESTYNVVGSNLIAPATVSASGNIAGFNPNSPYSQPFRGVGISEDGQTRNFLIGVNARF